jgi:acyl-CoA thioester hydrolase
MRLTGGIAMFDAEALSRFRFFSPAKVRFAETDANGHMSHVSAILYMEQARCEYLTALGMFDPEQMAREGKTFVLARQSIDYKAQAYFSETLDTYCRISRYGHSSLDIDYVIINRDTRAVIAVAASTIVYFDSQKQKSTPLPSDLRERVERLDASYPPLSLS